MSLQVFHGVGACGWDSLAELAGPSMRLPWPGPVDKWCPLEQWEVEAIEQEMWRYAVMGGATTGANTWSRSPDAARDESALMRHPEGRHAAMAALVFGCCCGQRPSGMLGAWMAPGSLLGWMATHRRCRPSLRVQIGVVWDRLASRQHAKEGNEATRATARTPKSSVGRAGDSFSELEARAARALEEMVEAEYRQRIPTEPSPNARIVGLSEVVASDPNITPDPPADALKSVQPKLGAIDKGGCAIVSMATPGGGITWLSPWISGGYIPNKPSRRMRLVRWWTNVRACWRGIRHPDRSVRARFHPHTVGSKRQVYVQIETADPGCIIDRKPTTQDWERFGREYLRYLWRRLLRRPTP